MNISYDIQSGIGKGRNPLLIRGFLAKNRLNMSVIARMAETYPSIVQATIRGVRNHKRVLTILENLGCPTAYLYGAEKDAERAS